MNINIVCIGKIKEKYFSDAIAEYAKRLGRFCKFNIVELAESSLKKESEILLIKADESRRILEKIKGYVVVLDLRGKAVSSQDLADTIKSCAVGGNSEISFVIGGSYGLSDEVLKKADEVVNFGKITFPHQLMRVVLAEQIYRAFMIGENSPYHK